MKTDQFFRRFRDTQNACPPTTLELTRMLLRPPLHNHLLLGIKLHGIAALTMEHAEEAVFPAAEREVRHRSGNSDIDSDVPCRRFIPEPSGRRSAGGKQRRLIAEWTLREEIERFIHVTGMHQTEHWSEDFRIGELASGGKCVEYSWLHKTATLVFRDIRFAAVNNQLPAFLCSCVNQRLNSFPAILADYRSHLDIRIQSAANFKSCRRGGDGLTECLLRFTHGDRHRNSQATLSSTAECTVTDDLGCHVHVCVRQDDDVVLGATLALHALAMFSTARIDVSRNRRRTNKADGSDLRMVDERVHNFLAAVDDVDHALGQTSLLKKLDRATHGERHPL